MKNITWNSFCGSAWDISDSGVATNGSLRVRGSQILTRAPGLTNLGARVSPTSTVTLSFRGHLSVMTYVTRM